MTARTVVVDGRTLTVHAENGTLWGEVVGLPGCFATGDDEAELVESAREAVRLYLTP